MSYNYHGVDHDKYIQLLHWEPSLRPPHPACLQGFLCRLPQYEAECSPLPPCLPLLSHWLLCVGGNIQHEVIRLTSARRLRG